MHLQPPPGPLPAPPDPAPPEAPAATAAAPAAATAAAAAAVAKPPRPFSWGERCGVMGILNLTPDSFSDGGRHDRPDAAVRHAARMGAEGADVIDLGAQSTRPGAATIGVEAELTRLLPALRAIREQLGTAAAPRLSVDTFHAAVAAAALAEGADWINDVSGGRRDPDILRVVAEAGCPYVLMHSRGDSQTMDELAVYTDVVAEVREELLRATDRAAAAGIRPERIVWDPGLGFAKNTAQNLALLRGLSRLRDDGFPLLVGPSRKRFIGEVLHESRPRARLWGTAAVCAQAIAAGAAVLRVHDVGPIVQVARMSEALLTR